MKKVSFKTAKAIKEAGYPQKCGLWYNKNGIEFSYTEDYSECYARPTYLEVWLWLWQGKCIKIDVTTYFDSVNGYKSLATILCYKYTYSLERDTPEEAIIAAIEYLVDDNLIK